MSEHTDTWVCDECGMRFGDFGPDELVDASTGFVARWRVLVVDLDDHLLRSRPAPDVWSAIEYGGHLRDTLGWMAQALRRTRDEDHPTIPFFDQEARVVEAGDVARPVDELTEALARNTAAFTDELRAVGDWSRTADYPWGTRDAIDMGRNGVHEGIHHLGDVAGVLDRLRG